MKKYFRISFLFVGFVIASTFLLSSCGPKITAQQAGEQLAEAMCDKQESCAAGSAFAKNLCLEGLKKAYPIAIKYSGGDKVKTEEVDRCVESIKGIACDQFMVAKFPKECPFIKMYAP